MKIKKRLVAVCAAMMLLSLTGCQLAKENAAEGKTQDRLAGVFITDAYLDLFDMEGYLNDNLNGFSGGEIKLDGASASYNGRLYATANAHADMADYTFPDTEGIQFFEVETPSDTTMDGMASSVCNTGMSDCHFGTYHGDDEDKITLDGTVYFVPGANGQVHYINPVYQSADGRIYATTGQGLSVEGIQSEGSVLSQKIEESITVTENGKSKKKTTSIKISIETRLPPQKIVLLQLDKNSVVLSRTEYAPGKLPASITPNSAADYLLLESYKTDFDGKEKIDRALVAKGSETVDSFYETDESVLVKQYTAVNWPE